MLCWLFGHWWYWWTQHIRVKESEMIPGFVYSCRRCPAEFNLLTGLKKEAS